jgi:hypothetical protein
MAEVHVRRVKETSTGDKELDTQEKDYTILIDKLGEEGGALVSRSRSMQQGMGLSYGEFKVSINDTATVSIHCKQTLKHVKLANKVACQLRDQFLEADFKESSNLLRKLMQAAASKRSQE